VGVALMAGLAGALLPVALTGYWIACEGRQKCP
jgi:hypothetical protein